MIRKARIDDVHAIYELVERFSEKGGMLFRPVSDIYDHLRDFFVYEKDGAVAGISSLHIWGPDVAEIRSLAVKDAYKGLGIGRLLVAACLDEARSLGARKVFALTYMTGFFERLDFRVVDKMTLPHKIWGDCTRCSKFPSCDETAVVKEFA